MQCAVCIYSFAIPNCTLLSLENRADSTSTSTRNVFVQPCNAMKCSNRSRCLTKSTSNIAKHLRIPACHFMLLLLLLSQHPFHFQSLFIHQQPIQVSQFYLFPTLLKTQSPPYFPERKNHLLLHLFHCNIYICEICLFMWMIYQTLYLSLISKYSTLEWITGSGRSGNNDDIITSMTPFEQLHMICAGNEWRWRMRKRKRSGERENRNK